jgi:hypothetical protein
MGWDKEKKTILTNGKKWTKANGSYKEYWFIFKMGSE